MGIRRLSVPALLAAAAITSYAGTIGRLDDCIACDVSSETIPGDSLPQAVLSPTPPDFTDTMNLGWSFAPFLNRLHTASDSLVPISTRIASAGLLEAESDSGCADCGQAAVTETAGASRDFGPRWWILALLAVTGGVSALLLGIVIRSIRRIEDADFNTYIECRWRA